MHRRLANEATLALSLALDGPLLIKAAGMGVDPTRPEMEFVRTRRAGAETVYLPGSSLKGALRAHAERIARTVGGMGPDGRPRLSCNPLTSVPDGPNYSCNRRLADLAVQRRGRELGGQRAYRESCAVCQLFGNAADAGHLAAYDAYPASPPRVEQRTGVSIDRVYGSVAEGPFGYEVATTGSFEARLVLQNFTLAQLGLLALTVRDLADGRLAIGYGKSRGLGRVRVESQRLSVRYPGCTVADGQVVALAGATIGPTDQLHGVGAFPDTAGYGFPAPDAAPLPGGMPAEDDGWGGVELEVAADGLPFLWRACVARWAERVRAAAEAS